MHIRPATGVRVRDPDLRDFLPDAGRVVPDSVYWRRRLRDGDVVPVADEPPTIPDTPDDPDATRRASHRTREPKATDPT
ncbi:DUF2635 domain-containing protein [Paraburkholderia sp. 31.1]|uniref:DUF2635 domain-containing protein n=1 Tax=Paraburkholderia sp. 31.1 TaxID=2615205 RepID=UPI0016563CE6|nr:DUF2635 domain-containing protein [Paraburkholderia sp. 31.1]MBC8722132.1 DUF2635 domain-containing protein [Paraburkholderia sp. 31.1]